MDDLLKKAIEHRRRAIQQRDELAEVIRSLDEFIANYEKALAAKPVPGPLKDMGQRDLFEHPVSRAERVQHVAKMMQVAEELILAAGRPLTRSELLAELEGRGFNIEGGDRSKVLGTNLWRSKRFDNFARAGYWPRGKPLPDAFSHLRKRPSILGDN